MVYVKNCPIPEVEYLGTDEAPCDVCIHSYYNKNNDYEYTCEYPKNYINMKVDKSKNLPRLSLIKLENNKILCSNEQIAKDIFNYLKEVIENDNNK